MAPGAPLLLAAILLAAQAREPGANRASRLRLGSLTGSVSNRVIEELDVDAIVQRIDVDGVLARVDVEGVLARVDVNALLDRVDPDRLLDRVDPDRLLDRVDPDRLLDRVDPDRLLDRVEIDRLLGRADVDALLAAVDVHALLDRVEVDAVLARVDLDALVARVDLDAVLARVDLDALVARIDLDAVLETVDIEGLTRRAGIPELVAESTGQAANSALDLTRRQLVAVDVGLLRVVQRLLRRDPGTLPPGPPRLLTDRPGEVQDPQLSRSRTKARIEVSGYYAGPASRLLAVAGDLVASAGTFTAAAVTVSWLLSVVAGVSFDATQRSGPLWAGALVLWYLLWWWVSVSVAGRTPVMALVGLKVVNRDGTPIRAGRSLLRTAILPLSLGAFGAGMLLVLIDRERRSFHDLVSGAAVVYDWGGRPAELPSPISRWLAERGGATQGASTTDVGP
ncbi:MAG: RDD family protein [Nitriliruptoraceae bacterium]